MITFRELMKLVDAELCYRQAGAHTSDEVLNAFVDRYGDLIPIDGTRYAIPKERWEAAAQVHWETMRHKYVTKGNDVTWAQLSKQKQQAHIEDFVAEFMPALATIFNGEVLPVEAVGVYREAEYPDGFPTLDGKPFVGIEGDRVAIVVEKEQADD